MNDLYFKYEINVWTNYSVTLDWERTLEDAEDNFNRSIKRCNGDEHTVVLTHEGYVFTGRNKYQAEEKLRQVKKQYPTYTCKLTGTGAWDDEYCVSIEKVIKKYNVWTKQLYCSN